MLPKDKQEALELRWLQLAVIREETHPVLQCINFEEDRAVATDGFRIHIVNKPNKETGLLKLNNGKPLHKSPREIKTEEDDGQFPGISRVIPEGEPMLAFGVSRHLLMEALEMPNETGFVIIKVYGQDKPIVIEDVPEKGKESIYKSAIMPVHLGRLQ